MTAMLLILIAADAFGCAAHQTAVTPPLPHKGVPTTLSITVPRPPGYRSTGPNKYYISSGTKSAALSINSEPPLGLDLSQNSPFCVQVPNGLSCTFGIVAPLGLDTFALTAYNGVLGGNGQPTGKILSTGSVNAFINEGKANQVLITLDGVIAKITLAVSGPMLYWDASRATVSQAALDASGYTIIGHYESEIDLTLTPPKTPERIDGSFFQNSGDTLTLADNGDRAIGGTPAIVASATFNGKAVKKTLKVPPQIQHATFIIAEPGGSFGGGFWVSTPIDRALQPGVVVPLSFNKGSSHPSSVVFAPSTQIYGADPGNESIDVYLAGTGITEGQIGYIRGSATGIVNPTSITADSAMLYLLMPTSIEVFSQAKRGNIAPVAVVSGPDTGLIDASCIAVDAAHMYVLSGSGSEIEVFPLTSNGDSAPTAVITGPNTGLNGARGIAVDSAGNLFVANTGSADVEIFPATANGDVPPTMDIGGPATLLGQPYAIGEDGNGDLWVADITANLVLEFAPGASGDVAPIEQAEIADNAIQASTAMSVWP